MNGKYGIAALLMAVAMSAPAVADEVNTGIRAQGEQAIDAMRADIRPSLPGFEAPVAKRGPLTVDESIRASGRVAMRSMERDLDIARTASPVGPPEVLDRQGLVTVSAYSPADEPTVSESL